MKSLLVFIPNNFPFETSGYINGKVLYDNESDSKKFYVININTNDSQESNSELIGYYSGAQNTAGCRKKINDWIEITFKSDNTKDNSYYSVKNVIVDTKTIEKSNYHTVIIIYDQKVLIKSELFRTQNLSGNHFLELKDILEKKIIEDKIKKKNYFENCKETLLMYMIIIFMYPVLFLSKVTSKLMPIFKYSTLGLHLSGWLENIKWILLTIIQDKKFTLKTLNPMVAITLDILLGVFLIRFLMQTIDERPSHILLDNAEKVVDTLKNLVNWLMGAPAGLKLNYSFNKMLGKFFLYHIHFWWTFLVSIKPVMDFFFDVLMLFGRLGITFQIAIAADILALVSFHAYCIYVYAARLFNLQMRGLTALFRLFLGKKKNPLRERVDSCQYQADQLFVGTLLFTILLFLMPTTWVYYTVFTTLRVIIIGFGGILTKLRFYFQILPVYTFLCWLFNSRCVHSSVKISLKSIHQDRSSTLMMTTVRSSWSETWVHCIPDTINHNPPIEWKMIVKNIFWGELLYPL
ncbi:phosphatidylinositol N-acetylglucosaminyltransferase subunit Q [Microplitis demolitor]|uniref:phosphatidylinositol N-acetylglucosaminyltransferase subunit Q n=1 Tax=Microplitis demolitor TaxID=69319 RepID=UPI0004CDC26C|nr:phosphatidylinositol N-acetylglucosaminyltransferase subunit Q [Microplitis demolitor]XP_053596956.1 phosphatidylinositol N-acetylglucosaminyltransferase subunit Q [Microplitis demolitor]